MPRITLSYRRDDSAPAARLIFERLRARYGADSVFMDIDSIEFGEDFRERINHALRQTDYLLVLIGQRWLGPNGDRNRIMDANDPVRMEVERAIETGLRVVPILLEGAKMPGPDLLPEGLGRLPYLNAADVTTGREFDSQIDRVIRFIDRTFAETEARRAREAQEQELAAVVVPPNAAAPLPDPAPSRVTPTATPQNRALPITVAIVGLVGGAFGLFEAFSHNQTAPVVALAAPSTPEPGPQSADAIVGTWLLNTGYKNTFAADGTIHTDHGSTGTWQSLGAGKYHFTLTGISADLTMAPDGRTYTERYDGETVTATKQ